MGVCCYLLLTIWVKLFFEKIHFSIQTSCPLQGRMHKYSENLAVINCSSRKLKGLVLMLQLQFLTWQKKGTIMRFYSFSFFFFWDSECLLTWTPCYSYIGICLEFTLMSHNTWEKLTISVESSFLSQEYLKNFLICFLNIGSSEILISIFCNILTKGYNFLQLCTLVHSYMTWCKNETN